MGQFNEGSPLGKEEKKGAPSPGLGRPGLGFLGGRPAYLGCRRPCSSPWPLPHGCLSGGVRCTPSPLYKGGALGGGDAQHIHEPSSTASSYHLPGTLATPWPLPSPSFTPVWPPEGLHRRRESPLPHTVRLGDIVVTVHVRVRRGVARAVLESLLQYLHDLEVSYVVFIINACVGT
jgi:hypothetical protein